VSLVIVATVITAPVKIVSPGTDWATWAVAFATFLLACAALRALKSLRDAKRTRHATLITDLTRRFDEPLVADSWELWANTGQTEIMALIEKVYVSRTATVKEHARLLTLMVIPNLLETIGVLESEGALEAKTIYKMWGDTIIGAWNVWKRPIGRLRESEANRPWTYQYFQDLARKMRRIEAKRRREQRKASAVPASPTGGAVADQSDQNGSSDSPPSVTESSDLSRWRRVAVTTALVGLLSVILAIAKRSFARRPN